MNELCCGPYLVDNVEQYLQAMRDLEVSNVPSNTLQDFDQVIILTNDNIGIPNI